ncbi:MAG TPA: surface lipoprotein assembly modifier, partial [Burkholderiales bacterium]|nr:surface lipoprotein assembly modifier [Burkholderiales bacterium]
NRYRDAAGLTGQWQHAFDDFTSLTGYVQWTALDYPGQNLRDVNRTVAGVGFAKALAMDRNPVVFAGFYTGEENERNNGVPYLGHRLWGARLGGQFNFRSDLIPFASASLERRGYGGPDPLFVVTRRDIQSDFRVGVNYLPAKLWTITPQIAYTGNDSNVQINDYNRTVYFVSVRRDFR